MNVQAEISLYPLRTHHLGHAIGTFLGKLKAAGLTVAPGNMSSTVSGEIDAVFSTVGTAFQAAAGNDPTVLVMKVSNACPSGDTGEGANADARPSAQTMG
ncbi:MAG TPA: YkoF family thiamine/hydroxymethylpyrimidine-binding protein [Phycisphaerae bacterium]|nr:YkoF family thiamine/hydroxymethylpyrimidine-binding protein [Phycisphaerae bacterium]